MVVVGQWLPFLFHLALEILRFSPFIENFTSFCPRRVSSITNCTRNGFKAGYLLWEICLLVVWVSAELIMPLDLDPDLNPLLRLWALCLQAVAVADTKTFYCLSRTLKFLALLYLSTDNSATAEGESAGSYANATNKQAWSFDPRFSITYPARRFAVACTHVTLLPAAFQTRFLQLKSPCLCCFNCGAAIWLIRSIGCQGGAGQSRLWWIGLVCTVGLSTFRIR